MPYNGLSQNNNTTQNSNFYKLTHNGIWSWFSDPRAVQYKEKIYTGWVDNYGDIQIASFDLKTHTLQSRVVYDALEIDDHNNPSILVDSQGYLHVFFTTHVQDEKPIYYLKSSSPENIFSWSALKTLTLNDEKEYAKARSLNHTYTNPIELKENDNTIFLFWRGVNYLPSVSKSTDFGKTWSKGKILFRPTDSKEKTVPYTKVFSKGEHKIHFTFTDAHPKAEGMNTLYYTYYENGNFYKANGTLIKSINKLPLKASELDVVYTSETSDVWNWDIAEDKNGNPVVGFASFEGKENHIYNYSKFQKGQWKNHRLINSGNWFPKDQNPMTQPEPYYSGGMTINHTDPNTIYLSIKQNGIFEIEKWRTKNNGKDWKKTPITKHSKTHNIRPYAIKNSSDKDDLEVLWLNVENYIYYGLQSKQIRTFNDRFKSSIHGNLPQKKVENRFNRDNIILFLNTLHDDVLAKLKLDTMLYDLSFNMFFEASKTLAQVSNNTIKLTELENIIEISGEDVEVDNLNNEGLLWYKNFEENREITVRLSELDITSFDINSNAYQFVLLTRLIEINPDNLVTNEAKKYIETTINTKNGFDWLTKSKSQSDLDSIFSNSTILYSKFWLHKNGFIQFDIEELNEDAQNLYKLAVKHYLKKTGFKDIKTISLFTLVMTEFIKLRPSF